MTVGNKEKILTKEFESILFNYSYKNGKANFNTDNLVEHLGKEPAFNTEFRTSIFKIMYDYYLKKTKEGIEASYESLKNKKEDGKNDDINYEKHSKSSRRDTGRSAKRSQRSSDTFKLSGYVVGLGTCNVLLISLFNIGESWNNFISHWIINTLSSLEKYMRKSPHDSLKHKLAFLSEIPAISSLLKVLNKSTDFAFGSKNRRNSLSSFSFELPSENIMFILKDIVGKHLWWVIPYMCKTMIYKESLCVMLHSILYLHFSNTETDKGEKMDTDDNDEKKKLKPINLKPAIEVVEFISSKCADLSCLFVNDLFKSFQDGSVDNGYYLLHLFKNCPVTFGVSCAKLMDALKVNKEKTINAFKNVRENSVEESVFLVRTKIIAEHVLDMKYQSIPKISLEQAAKDIVLNNLDCLSEIAYDFVLLINGTEFENTVVKSLILYQLELNSFSHHGVVTSDSKKQDFCSALRCQIVSLCMNLLRKIQKKIFNHPNYNNDDNFAFLTPDVLFLYKVVKIIGFSCNKLECAQICELFLDTPVTGTNVYLLANKNAYSENLSEKEQQEFEKHQKFFQVCFYLFEDLRNTFEIKHPHLFVCFVQRKIKHLHSSSQGEILCFLSTMMSLIKERSSLQNILWPYWTELLKYFTNHANLIITITGLELLTACIPKFDESEFLRIVDFLISFIFNLLWETTRSVIRSLESNSNDSNSNEQNLKFNTLQKQQKQIHSKSKMKTSNQLNSNSDRNTESSINTNKMADNSSSSSSSSSSTTSKEKNDELTNEQNYTTRKVILAEKINSSFVLIKAICKQQTDQENTPVFIAAILNQIFEPRHSPLFHLDSLAAHEEVIHKLKLDDDLVSVAHLTKLNDGKGDRRRQHFHTGLIGKLNRPVTFRSLPSYLIDGVHSCVGFNKSTIVNLFWNCATADKDSSIFIKHLAVQLNKRISTLSPAVTEKEYDQILPKPTHFPRDRHCRKLFQEFPLMWLLLDIIAEDPPILWTFLSEVKSMLAAVIGEWYMVRNSKIEKQPELLVITQLLVNILAKALWIPNPLNQLAEILPYIESKDVETCLMNVWSFIRDIPPHPGMFVKNESGTYKREFELGCVTEYLVAIKGVFRSNIDSIGSSYGRFFPCNSDQLDSEMQTTPVM